MISNPSAHNTNMNCKSVKMYALKHVNVSRVSVIVRSNSVVQRYETCSKDNRKRFETEFVQLRAQHNIHLTKLSQQYDHTVSLLKQQNMSLQHELYIIETALSTPARGTF